MKSHFERIGRTVTVETAHRSCLDKRRYESRNHARDASKRNARKYPSDKPQRPYRCTGFHLTSQVPAGLREGKAPRDAGQTKNRS